MESINPLEETYLNGLRDIIKFGKNVPTRAILKSTGKKIEAKSIIGYMARYDLQNGFPAVTTKRLAFRSVVHELCWFLAGETNVKSLHKNNVHIWDDWADPKTGDIGPIYGRQWRSWLGDPRQDSVDQINMLVDQIKTVRDDPTASVGRRMIVSAWNPPDIELMGLPPCHVLFQFFVRDGRLSSTMYQRSADAFLGVPFNIASYSLLTHLLARIAELEVGEFIHMIGDFHIYTNHLDLVEEQLGRKMFEPPKLVIPDRMGFSQMIPGGIFSERPAGTIDLPNEYQSISDGIYLENYVCHGPLKGEVAV